MAGWDRQWRRWAAGLVAVALGTIFLAEARAEDAPKRAAGKIETGIEIELEVDARDLPRHLVHSRMVVPCRPGKLALWYPKWVPGTHAPCGPIQDVAGLFINVNAPDGPAVAWRRDDADPYRVVCDVPEGAASVVVRLDTICNEPAVEAAGHLTYGNGSVGIINWHTCLMYPEGPSADDTRVKTALRLPSGWSFACALKSRGAPDDGNEKPPSEGAIRFEPISLVELVDNPLIAGRHLRRIALDVGKYPPAWMDVVSESPDALRIGPDVVAKYGRVAREAGALFGSCHYPSFHFLVTCSDELGYLGLEHLACSLNGVRERDLVDPGRLRGWVANLLPHEYVHSWCGKYRRPAGMCTESFQQPLKGRLLWVYEGLTEYLGEVLMVRAGLATPDDYRRGLADAIGELSHRAGRKWRTLEDVGAASPLLRSRSRFWNDLRRSQDYYFEGALVWLEADAIIRERTAGRRSLDDFCRKFLGGPTSPRHVVPYELEDVVRDLRSVADFDWAEFLEKRVARPGEALSHQVVERCGYRVNYAPRPSAGGGLSHGGEGALSARDSLGLSFGADGRIVNVTPGAIGDRAGLGPGMKVVGVNDRAFSGRSLQDALKESPRRGKVEFLLLDGDRFRPLVLDYDGGPRHLELVRDLSRPDLLAAILRPKAPASQTAPPTPPNTPPMPAPRGYVCRRAARPISIDGRLDDADWKSAAWTARFVDIEGERNDRPRPRLETRARMLWDDQYFYIGAAMEEPHVRAALTRHDSVIFHDNDFEIFIDPNGDNHEYYEIEINALNTVWDLFLKKPYRDGGPARNGWEIPGLKTAVHVVGTLNDPSDLDAGWSVEMAVPWKALGEHAHRAAPPRDGDEWRVNFSRVEWRHQIVEGAYRKVPNTREDNWAWSPQGAIDMHRPERWGRVRFSSAPAGANVPAPGPSAEGPARDHLMRIYYAQKAFHARQKRWAGSLEELGLADPMGLATEIEPTADGYEAVVAFEADDGQSERLAVRQDSRISRP